MCVGVALWWCGIRMQAEALLVCSRGMWGLMTVWNRGFISPGFCSGMSLPSWWRDWI